jgi:hypothetical protein
MRCQFTKSDNGWACGVCGRLVRLDSETPPIAACGQARQPAEDRTLDARAAAGPGTELSKLLKRFGIKATPACKCRAVVARMDAWGPDECSKPARVDEVVAVMREEAAKRGLPFLDSVGRLLVRRAISRARAIELEVENNRSQEG